MRNVATTVLTRRNFLKGGAAALALGLPRKSSATVPDYWKSALDRVANRVASLQAAGAGEASFFFTDVHNASNGLKSGALIGELVRLTGCRKAFCGGDIPCAYGSTNYKAALDLAISNYTKHWVEPIHEAGGLLISAKGNHDFTIRESSASSAGYTYADAKAREFIAASYHRPFAVTNASDPIACYCYRDVPAERLRWIVADSQDNATTDSSKPWGVNYGMHQTQLEWLADVALATVPAGWSVIVMQHIPCAPIVESGGITSSLVTFRQLLEAYQNRGKITLFGTTRDYAAAKGRILVNVTGHHHSDRWTFLNGIHHLTVSCDARYNDMKQDSPFCNADGFVRTSNTVHEHVVDALQWCAVSDVVSATRLGEGQDRSIHVTPVSLPRGETHRFEPTVLSGAVTWACYDGDGATFDSSKSNADERWVFRQTHGSVSSDGVFQAGQPGSSVVLAMDAAFNKEIFGVAVT